MWLSPLCKVQLCGLRVYTHSMLLWDLVYHWGISVCGGYYLYCTYVRTYVYMYVCTYVCSCVCMLLKCARAVCSAGVGTYVHR